MLWNWVYRRIHRNKAELSLRKAIPAALFFAYLGGLLITTLSCDAFFLPCKF